MCNYKFSKLIALRKGRSGVWSLEEGCLKFNQVEENIKAFSVNDSKVAYSEISFSEIGLLLIENSVVFR